MLEIVAEWVLSGVLIIMGLMLGACFIGLIKSIFWD